MVEEPKKDKIHISKFLILVNSNKSAKSHEEHANEIADCLRDGIGRLLQEHSTELFKLHPSAKPGGLDTIMDIKVRTAAEIGPKYHRIHVHSLITVKHRTLLQMRAEPFKEYLPQYCVSPFFDKIFARIKFVPVSDFAELYLTKSPV